VLGRGVSVRHVSAHLLRAAGEGPRLNRGLTLYRGTHSQSFRSVHPEVGLGESLDCLEAGKSIIVDDMIDAAPATST
jgi:hypothetical protein